MNPYIELLRPYNGILAILGIIVGAIVGLALGAPLFVVLALVPAFLINGAGNTINDYFDWKIDKINKPKRPIPSGRVSRQNVLYYFLALIVVSLVISYLISISFFYIAIINSIVSFVYAWKLKGTPLIGNAAVSYLAASTFIAGALVTHTFGDLTPAVLILASIAFFGTLSREIYKDVEDVKGDKQEGAKTMPIVIGEKPAKIIAGVVLVLAILSLLAPIATSAVSIFYYVGMVPAVIICVAALAAKSAHKSQKFVKYSMYFVFLGFILGVLL